MGGVSRVLQTGQYRLPDETTRMALRQAWSVAPAAGLLWGVLAWTSSSWAMLSAALLYGLAGVAAAWVDLDAPRIPDRLLVVAAPLVAVTGWAGVAVQGQCWRVWTSLAAAGVLTLVYAAQAWFGSMGWGDVKLAAVTGLSRAMRICSGAVVKPAR